MPIKMQPEPPHFHNVVVVPGSKFLAQNPHPTGRQWRGHEYWTQIIPDLYDAYGGICAYSCHWTPPDTGWKTVEHFKPKSKYPEEAYCWANYRFVCGLLNGRKGDHEDVLDPFTLQEGWFVLRFPGLLLAPGDQLASDDAGKVLKTIARLKLNDEACVRGREHWLLPYLEGSSFEYLERHAPFLAFELVRQGLLDRELPLWDAFRRLTGTHTTPHRSPQSDAPSPRPL